MVNNQFISIFALQALAVADSIYKTTSCHVLNLDLTRHGRFLSRDVITSAHALSRQSS